MDCNYSNYNYKIIIQIFFVLKDETTTYINASTCNDDYQAINEPILFDILIPDGFSKTTEIRSFISTN